TRLTAVAVNALLAVRTAALLNFLLQKMVDDLQAGLSAQGFDFRFGLQDHVQDRQVELEVHRVDVEFGPGFRQRTVVLFLHAVGGFGLFIYFTAELVGSAAKPPTAFSTIHGTFPQPMSDLINTSTITA